MGKTKFSKNDLKKILIQKAKGYFYEEAQFEYEKTQKASKKDKKQLSFFENNENFVNLKKSDRGENIFQKSCDTLAVSDENETQEDSQNLTLVKKKVTTHYVPPDMVAIKTLLENFSKKVDEKDVEDMTDDELISLKNKLIMEIQDEN